MLADLNRSDMALDVFDLLANRLTTKNVVVECRICNNLPVFYCQTQMTTSGLKVTSVVLTQDNKRLCIWVNLIEGRLDFSKRNWANG